MARNRVRKATTNRVRTRPCTKCGRPFDPALWRTYLHKASGNVYWQSQCNACIDARQNAWREANRAAVNGYNRTYRKRVKGQRLAEAWAREMDRVR